MIAFADFGGAVASDDAPSGFMVTIQGVPIQFIKLPISRGYAFSHAFQATNFQTEAEAQTAIWDAGISRNYTTEQVKIIPDTRQQ